MLFEKKILVGITGGIAAYRSAQLIRILKKASADVRVMMTKAATNFVGPLTFETLSENPVLTDLFSAGGTIHIDWARWPDLIVICPATANIVGKVANGIADDVVTTTVMASTAPLVFCPAMNKEMYANRIYQANQNKLIEQGYLVVAPAIGELACGEVGWGRLADLNDIVDNIEIRLGTKEFSGKKILVTAGPTYEPVDPVRFLGNRSSAKMGFAVAARSAIRGADVTLVAGPNHLRPFSGIKLIRVESAQEMAQEVSKYHKESDILIMSAAVSDFRPVHTASQKIKKDRVGSSLALEPTIDILAALAPKKGDRMHVGFSLETENELQHSEKKLREKNLDLIVINNPTEAGAGFGVDTNVVTLLQENSPPEKLPKMTKLEVADKILDRVYNILSQKL